MVAVEGESNADMILITSPLSFSASSSLIWWIVNEFGLGVVPGGVAGMSELRRKRCNGKVDAIVDLRIELGYCMGKKGVWILLHRFHEGYIRGEVDVWCGDSMGRCGVAFLDWVGVGMV